MNDEKLKIKLKEKDMIVEEINELMIAFEADNLKSTNKSAMKRNRSRLQCLNIVFSKYKKVTIEIAKLIPKRKPTNQNWKNNPIFKKKNKQ